LAVSSVPAKPSQRKLRVASATSGRTHDTPSVVTMPTVSTLLVSLNRISQSTV
jgi:hypothetical protein